MAAVTFTILTVLDQYTFNLRCGQAMTGDINHVVEPSSNPVVSIMIAIGSVTGELRKIPMISTV
jgi:hypothetical protein